MLWMYCFDVNKSWLIDWLIDEYWFKSYTNDNDDDDDDEVFVPIRCVVWDRRS